MITIKSTTDGITLEFRNNTGWYLVINDKVFSLNISEYRVILSLLPFLEMGRNHVLEKIKNSSEASSLFPEQLLIEAGLKNGSEHWSACAIGWLEENKLKYENIFRCYLENIVKDKKYSQSLRHRAIALIKEL